MTKFILTQKMIDDNAHISNQEIERDIADTQSEIDEYRQRVKAYEDLALHGPEHERKLYRFRADAIPRMIQERVEFNEKLIALLDARVRRDCND